MGYAEKLIEWYHLTLETIALRLSEQKGQVITADDIHKVIAEIYGYTDNNDVQRKVGSDGLNIYEVLSDYYFSENIGEIELELAGENRIIIEGDDQEILEALVKNKNQLWKIHKNDKDPHPSNPHGHNYSSGLKLDLSNGDLYKKRIKISKIDRKQLLEVRQKFIDKGIALPSITV